ncbi:unnamed protein product [Pylaiella littoralis]
MENGSIMSMIAGFLPPASTTQSSPSPPAPPSSSRRSSLDTAHAHRNEKDSPPSSSRRSSLDTAHAHGNETVLLPPAAGGDDAAAAGVPRRRVVHMICFSKNRAFQLDQLLESSMRHLLFAKEESGQGGQEGARTKNPGVQLRVSVLYLASGFSAATDLNVDVAAAAAAATRGKEKGAALSSSRSGCRTMQGSYDLVQQKHPGVRFVRERPGEFCKQLCSLVGEEQRGEETVAAGPMGGDGFEEGGEAADNDVGETFVLFAVDDMFFYRDFELSAALRLLSRDSSTFCVHLRLHPGITWSHTSGSPCNVPPLYPTDKEVILQSRGGVITGTSSSGSGTGTSSGISRGEVGSGGSSKSDELLGGGEDEKVGRSGCEKAQTRAIAAVGFAAADFDLLVFDRAGGTGEWDYPWDLTGGLYRREDAMTVVNGIVRAYGREAAANPNLLEYHGHALLQQKDLPRGRSSSSSHNTSNAVASTQSTARGVGLDFPATDAVALATLRSTAATTATAASCFSPSTSGSAAAAAAAVTISAAVNAASAAPRCACPGMAVVSSLAVNRVQRTYTTPVYVSQGGGVGDLDRRLWSPRGDNFSSPRTVTTVAVAPAADRKEGEKGAAAAGERRREEGGVQDDREAVVCGVAGAGAGAGRGSGGGGGGGGGGFDGQAYRRRRFNSVHVGELWFNGDSGGGMQGDGVAVSNGVAVTTTLPGRTERGDSTSNSESDTIHHHQLNGNLSHKAVTVLLPVRNGGDHLLHAVESVVSCAREMPSGWDVELLVVDDGSDDGAVELAVAAIADDAGDNTAAKLSGCGGGDSTTRVPEHVVGVEERRAGGDGSAADVYPGGGQRGEKDAEAEECRVRQRLDRVSVDAGDAGGGGGGGGTCAPLSESGRGRSGGFSVRLLRHDRPVGLAESLNEGLREARSDLVARMDADDVCMPGRLRQQVAFMLEFPHISVVGTSVATFSGQSIRGMSSISNGRSSCDRRHHHDNQRHYHHHHHHHHHQQQDRQGRQRQSPKQEEQQQLHQQPMQPQTEIGAASEPGTVLHLQASGVQRVARHPTDPAFLAWSMLFGCFLAHPSAMLRRDRVVDAGGYDPAAEPAEDYDLWLRMEADSPGCVSNLGEVLLGLRKHEKNVSRRRRQEQEVAADAAAARAMTRLLERRQHPPNSGAAAPAAAAGAGAEAGAGAGAAVAATPAQAAAIRRPESAASAEDLAEAARLLGHLGAAAVSAAAGTEPVFATRSALSMKEAKAMPPRTPGNSSGNSPGAFDAHSSSENGAGCDDRRRDREMITRDVEARITALAVLAMSRFGGGGGDFRCTVLHQRVHWLLSVAVVRDCILCRLMC